MTTATQPPSEFAEAHCSPSSGFVGSSECKQDAVGGGGVGLLRFAYADPPYIGQARKHYSHDPNCAEVDHAELIARLNTYDAWALSLSSPSLKQILALCPDDVRVGSWVKPFCAFKANVNPAYAWEPVIFRGGRKLGRGVDTVRDWVSEVITLKRGLSGAKPERFCHWVFEFLGMRPGDAFDDIYPGSGAVSRAWQTYCASPRLSFASKAGGGLAGRQQQALELEPPTMENSESTTSVAD